MRIEKDNSRDEGPMTYASIVDKGMAILIDDSSKDDQVTPPNALIE